MQQRRTFLNSSLACSFVVMAVASGLLTPVRVLGHWNRAAFNATRLHSAMKSALGSDLTESSKRITIQAPEIAENGAVVPLIVSSSLQNTEIISLFAVQNKTPLIAQFELSKDTQAYISTRIKMRKTSELIAVVSAGGKNYSARKEIKVIMTGCQN